MPPTAMLPQTTPLQFQFLDIRCFGWGRHQRFVSLHDPSHFGHSNISFFFCVHALLLLLRSADGKWPQRQPASGFTRQIMTAGHHKRFQGPRVFLSSRGFPHGCTHYSYVKITAKSHWPYDKFVCAFCVHVPRGGCLNCACGEMEYTCPHFRWDTLPPLSGLYFIRAVPLQILGAHLNFFPWGFLWDSARKQLALEFQGTMDFIVMQKTE